MRGHGWLAVVASALIATACAATTPVPSSPEPPFDTPTAPTGSSRPVNPEHELRIIGGYVTDAAGAAVPFARVSVKVDGVPVDEVETGADGEFQFVGLYPPALSLAVEAPGYAGAERTVLVDDSRARTFVPDIALVLLPPAVTVGHEGGVVQTETGAAVVFQQNALPDGTSVVVYDAIGTPPTDQVPEWDDGLIRTPLGWVEVDSGGAQPAKPAIVVLPLREQYSPGDVLEVRSIDAEHRWSDEVTYAVVGESGRSAITLADHFSGMAVFTKRSEKVGPPTEFPRLSLTDEILIGEGTENCGSTERVRLDLRAPPAQFFSPVAVITSWFGGLPSGFDDSRVRKLPSHALSAHVQGVQSWKAYGAVATEVMEQRIRTEVKASFGESIGDTRVEPIEWPEGHGMFIQEMLNEYGVTVPNGIEIPAAATRKTWNSETRVLEYSVIYGVGSPYWAVRIETEPCPDQTASATLLPAPTAGPQMPAPPTVAPPATTTFLINAAAPGISVSVEQMGDEPHCSASVLSGAPMSLSIAGTGRGSDGKSYTWGVLLDTYNGPGTYSTNFFAEFEQNESPFNSWAGRDMPPATLTIHFDQKSGTFRATPLQPIVNSGTPAGEMTLTGAFDCELRLDPRLATPAP